MTSNEPTRRVEEDETGKNGQAESVKTDWEIVRESLTTPGFLFTAGLAVFLLVLGNIFNTKTITDHVGQLPVPALNVLGTFVGALAGRMFSKSYEDLTGSTILLKKGRAAVRHLSLARGKTDNISDRMKQGAKEDELHNLVQLLGKDIEDSIQEWNDIVPGVDEIAYSLRKQGEKEKEYNSLEIIFKDLQNELEKYRGEEKGHKEEKERLEKELSRMKTQKEKIEREIQNIRIGTANTTSAVTSAFSTGTAATATFVGRPARVVTGVYPNPIVPRGRRLGGEAIPSCGECGKPCGPEDWGDDGLFCPECRINRRKK